MFTHYLFPSQISLNVLHAPTWVGLSASRRVISRFNFTATLFCDVEANPTPTQFLWTKVDDDDAWYDRSVGGGGGGGGGEAAAGHMPHDGNVTNIVGRTQSLSVRMISVSS